MLILVIDVGLSESHMIITGMEPGISINNSTLSIYEGNLLEVLGEMVEFEVLREVAKQSQALFITLKIA